ncbi:CD1375 family protein [Acetatifactor aquisgranensis]
MAVIYATLIVKGKKSFADVPEKIREQVKGILIDLDCPELAE